MIGPYRGLRALGGSVLDLVIWVFARFQDAAWAKVEGRCHQFRGNPIDIHEEAGGLRWLSLRDLRRTLPQLPHGASLRHRFPSRLHSLGDPEEPRIEASALEELYAKASALDTRRFLAWLRRDVIFPARRKAQIERHDGR